jgi:hypothetical protein
MASFFKTRLSRFETLVAVASGLFLFLWLGAWLVVFTSPPDAVPDQVRDSTFFDWLIIAMLISAPLSVVANTYALLRPRDIPWFLLVALWLIAAGTIFLLLPFWLAVIPAPPVIWSVWPLIMRAASHFDEGTGSPGSSPS